MGVRDSQFNLAILYARGLGVEQDLRQSWLWFSLAAAQGDEDAAKKRDELAAKMAPDVLAAAADALAKFEVVSPIRSPTKSRLRPADGTPKSASPSLGQTAPPSAERARNFGLASLARERVPAARRACGLPIVLTPSRPEQGHMNSTPQARSASPLASAVRVGPARKPLRLRLLSRPPRFVRQGWHAASLIAEARRNRRTPSFSIMATRFKARRSATWRRRNGERLGARHPVIAQ